MHSQSMSHGLYLATMSIPNKLGIHYGIHDVGNYLRQTGVVGPRIYQLSPDGLTWTTQTSRLTGAERIEDPAGAAKRFRDAIAKPTYDLFSNNCEHFARYIAKGKSESPQAFWLGVGLFVAAGAVFASLGD